jgi:predicted nuclease of restriction endonuclease-like RecB superfamily
LLSADLLLVTSRDGLPGRAAPRYLGGRDEVWIRRVIEAFDAYVGRTVAELDAKLPEEVRKLAHDHGISARAADGVAKVLLRRFKAKVDTPLDPPKVRAILFEEAAKEDRFDRQEALARAAALLSAAPNEVAQALFADRLGRHRVIAPSSPPAASEIVDAYNLALVQGLLLRSQTVRVELRQHVRAVVRFAKLAGLLCTFSLSDHGTLLEVSGPLSILRHTTKYGFALASFFPAVVAAGAFRLDARCVLNSDPVLVYIDAADRVARTHKLPKDADSTLERILARDLRRLGSAWLLVREADAIAIGGRAFFPDFTLRHESGFAALVEVVGFYTPEYLQSKLSALRGAASRPLIVCVDENLACDDGELPGEVLRFKKRIDATALLAAAERLRAEDSRHRDLLRD